MHQLFKQTDVNSNDNRNEDWPSQQHLNNISKETFKAPCVFRGIFSPFVLFMDFCHDSLNKKKDLAVIVIKADVITTTRRHEWEWKINRRGMSSPQTEWWSVVGVESVASHNRSGSTLISSFKTSCSYQKILALHSTLFIKRRRIQSESGRKLYMHDYFSTVLDCKNITRLELSSGLHEANKKNTRYSWHEMGWRLRFSCIFLQKIKGQQNHATFILGFV